GEAAVERFHRVAPRLLHQPPPLAALWDADLDAPTGKLAERLFEQRPVGQFAVDQDRARRRHLLVELRQHPAQHLLVAHVLDVTREERAMAPVLPAADEEALDADLPALGRERE